MRSAGVAIAALLLAGCAAKIPPPAYVPPVLTCAEACDTPCDTSPPPPWAPPVGAGAAAWDYIKPQVVAVMWTRVRVCEERRAACVACLDQLDEDGIVVRVRRE